MYKIFSYLKIILVFSMLATLVANERQVSIEKHINCPCNKGILYDHDSGAANQLKGLISELVSDSINKKNIQELILKNYDKKQGDCLMLNINKAINDNSISDDDIYMIIGECYNKELIREENSSILYVIMLIFLISGFVIAFIFIYNNKKSRREA